MSKPKHTPGPWRLTTSRTIGNSIEGQSGRKFHDRDDGFRTVATFQDCCESRLTDEAEANMMANGLLICAAPDLLAACEEGLRLAEIAVRQGLSGPKKFIEDCVREHVSLVQIRAAIAKAKGQ